MKSLFAVADCPPDQLVFDTSVVLTSFSVRLGFVCGDFYLKGIFQSVVMAGQCGLFLSI